MAWRWRGVGRGLWRARCFALLQVTAGRAWPQRRRAGHWHGTGASQGRALALARGGDGANESSSAGRAGQGAGAGRGGGVVRGCGRAPVPLVFRAARWRRGGRGQQRRTSTGGRWRVALLGGDGADASSSAGRAGQVTGAGRGGAVVHGAAGARGMGGGGVGVVRGGVHVALLSSPVLVWCLLNKTGEGFSWRSTREKASPLNLFRGQRGRWLDRGQGQGLEAGAGAEPRGSALQGQKGAAVAGTCRQETAP